MNTKLNEIQKIVSIIEIILIVLLLKSCSSGSPYQQEDSLQKMFDSINSASLAGIDTVTLRLMDSIQIKWRQFDKTGDSAVLYQAIEMNEHLLMTDTSTNGFKHHVEMRRVLYALTDNPEAVLLSSFYPSINSDGIQRSLYTALKKMLTSNNIDITRNEFEKIIHACDSALSDSLNYTIIVWKADAQLFLGEYEDACATLDNACRYARDINDNFMAFQLECHKNGLKDLRQAIDSIIRKSKIK